MRPRADERDELRKLHKAGAVFVVSPRASVGDEARPVKVFFSYARRDQELRDQLEDHLESLKRQGVIACWHDRKIGAGREWKGRISEHLDSADIILLLISRWFMASDYCNVELKRAMNRHHRGEARVIPVILRPVDWRGAEFGELSALPRNGEPVTKWRNRDEALTDVASSIREILKPETEQWPGEFRSRPQIPGEDVEPRPIRRLILDLERAKAVGRLQESELAPDVLTLLRDEWDLKLAEPYDPDDIIDAIRAADEWYALVDSSVGEEDWHLDSPKPAVPIMVGLAWSLKRSADAQAVVLRWFDMIAKRLKLRVNWRADAHGANRRRNAIYRACLHADVLECERVLELLQGLIVTGTE